MLAPVHHPGLPRTRPDRRRRLARAALGAALSLGVVSCGGGGGAPDPDAVTGRVMSKTDGAYCVSPDRGATTSCVPLDQADTEAEVGECVRITIAPTPDARRLAPVDEAACAAGDLGDDAPDR